MKKGLEGKKIVIAASRKTEEMASLIEKQGGSCLVRPMQGTVFLAEEDLEQQLSELVKTGADWFMFTTGIGVETILNLADKMGIKDAWIEKVKPAKVAYRGYKTFSALKALGIKPVNESDGTTRGLVSQLQSYNFKDQNVVVQLHGDAAPLLTTFLDAQGAQVTQLLPYKHIVPDHEVSGILLNEILEGSVDAVCFTTFLQAQNLFSYARELGKHEELVDAFENRVLAVAVGKITAEGLEAEGVQRIIAPEHERMGAMIITLAQYMER